MESFYSASSFILNYNPISLGLYSASYIISSLTYSTTYTEKEKTRYIKEYNLIRKFDLEDIKKYNLIIIDMDGVLRTGLKKIGLSDIVIKKLNENGIPYIILTNDCMKNPKTIKHDLKLMGINIGNKNHVISASLLIKNKLMNLLNMDDEFKSVKKGGNASGKSKKRVGIVSSHELYSYVKSKIQLKHKQTKFYNINDNFIPSDLDYIVVGALDNDDNIDKNLLKTFQWLYNNPNAKLIIGCPDTQGVENMDKLIRFSPVKILQEIESRVKKNHQTFNWKTLKNIVDIGDEKIDFSKYKIKNEQIIIGKPYLDSMKEILDHYKVEHMGESYRAGPDFDSVLIPDNRDRILMIGDNLDTDMQLANKLQCDKALVMSGVTSYSDLINICRYDGKKKKTIDDINYIVPDISYIMI